MVATVMAGIGETEDGIPCSRQAHTRSIVCLVLFVALLVSRYCKHCKPIQYVRSPNSVASNACGGITKRSSRDCTSQKRTP